MFTKTWEELVDEMCVKMENLGLKGGRVCTPWPVLPPGFIPEMKIIHKRTPYNAQHDGSRNVLIPVLRSQIPWRMPDGTIVKFWPRDGFMPYLAYGVITEYREWAPEVKRDGTPLECLNALSQNPELQCVATMMGWDREVLPGVSKYQRIQVYFDQYRKIVADTQCPPGRPGSHHGLYILWEHGLHLAVSDFGWDREDPAPPKREEPKAAEPPVGAPAAAEQPPETAPPTA